VVASNPATDAGVNPERAPATASGKPAILGSSDSPGQFTDPVERALARAAELAAAAGEWDTVRELSRELGERRRARAAPDVASLDDERARREKERR
jgi:hypothetical protein